MELPDEFIELAAHYQPSPEVLQELGRRILVCVAGPTAVGKSSIMQAVAEQDNDFHMVQRFTTRPRRTGEAIDAYCFLPHTQEMLADLTDRLHARSLAQIAIHQTTGYIYGSLPADYPKPYNLLATLTSNLDAIRRLPFGHIVTIGVTTTEGDWKEWFQKRPVAGIESSEQKAKLDEAYTSLHDLLRDMHTLWLPNKPGKPGLHATAKELISMAHGDTGSNPSGRAHAIRLQNAIRRMRDGLEAVA